MLFIKQRQRGRKGKPASGGKRETRLVIHATYKDLKDTTKGFKVLSVKTVGSGGGGAEDEEVEGHAREEVIGDEITDDLSSLPSDIKIEDYILNKKVIIKHEEDSNECIAVDMTVDDELVGQDLGIIELSQAKAVVGAKTLSQLSH